MSTGKWVHRDRKCKFCDSKHVVRRGYGVRTYTDLHKKQGVKDVTLESKRYKCRDCDKSWTAVHADASPHGLVTKKLEAYIVKHGSMYGGRAWLSRDLAIPILRINRIFKKATDVNDTSTTEQHDNTTTSK